MSLTVYNDLTRKKETFVPVEPGKVRFYVCGPTVYNFFHIGNARPFVLFDVFRRYLESVGYEVTYVQNFTDIDDKMINRANEMGITVAELADRARGKIHSRILRRRRRARHPPRDRQPARDARDRRNHRHHREAYRKGPRL